MACGVGQCSCVCGEPQVGTSTGSEGACKGTHIQEGTLLLLPARKELLLKLLGRVFYLRALFTPALSVISGPSLLYLPPLAPGHTFVLQLLCCSDSDLLSHCGNNCCDT